MNNDPRTILVNKISEDILGENETNWNTISTKVNAYNEILEDVVRNFYELNFHDSSCPLFALVYLKNEGFSIEEYMAMVDGLERRVETKFEIDLKSLGYKREEA